MVQPLQDDRFPNAKAALAALQPIDVIREPAVELSAAVLEFKATHLGEKLTQTITVRNPIPDTVLEGKWQVIPHPHDPPHTPDSHAWISVEEPIRCTQKSINCRICVDTSKLMADTQYKRQLILHSNAYPSTHTVTVKVQTAVIPIEKRKLPYTGLIWLFLIAEMIAMATAWFTFHTAAEVASWLLANLGYNSVLFNFRVWVFIVAVNIVLHLINIKIMYPVFKHLEFLNLPVRTMIGFSINNSTMGSTVASHVSMIVAMAVSWAVASTTFPIGFAVALAVGWAVALAMFRTTYKVLVWAINLAEDLFTSVLLLLIAGLGASVGIGLIVGLLNPLIFLSLSGTGLPVLYMIFYPQIKRRKLIAKYRQSEDLLIRP